MTPCRDSLRLSRTNIFSNLRCVI